MGALRRAHSLPAADPAGPLDQAVPPAPSFHQREALVWRQQSCAGRRVRHAARTRRRRKKHHDAPALLKAGLVAASAPKKWHGNKPAATGTFAQRLAIRRSFWYGAGKRRFSTARASVP